jgi:hypothetical protein
MDIGSIFLILGLLILVALFIAKPLLDKKSVPVSREEHELSALLAEKDRLIRTLQELEFDYSLGKIPEEDYPVLRAAYMQHGADLLRKIDEFQPASQPAAAEDRLEAAINARRQTMTPALNGVSAANGSNGVHVPDDALEQMIAARRRTRPEKAGGFCPKCGGVVQQSDRFCPKCGASLV